ncbi:hypothetical protein Glove_119g40 [Diversispora epigaea]|uniref:Uncharacterized protein n=1 Tax=Diversispora epigaea TaxID=1348612 RepID=A0A397J699_9GLOM|nr:hypothetical protein Glove_119g40 [Diversispora epigaea]
MFHSVFGKNKKLAKKLKPWHINLLLEIARSGWVKIKSKIIEKFNLIDRDPLFKDTYSKTRHYLYSQTTLDFLYKKTSLFLLNYFENIFKNQGKSIPKYTGRREKKLKTYQLATLGEEVDLRYLPTAYNTSHLPKLGLCDACGFPLNNNNSAILTCSHNYHVLCYSEECNYCENFYKIGIFENVNSFLKRLEKSAEILTQEDFDNVKIEIEEEEETEEIESEKMDVSSLLKDAINKIESW